MPKKPVYLTHGGKDQLEAELRQLIDVGRPEIAAVILAAREDGDLKENGAYHDAKDRQGFMEGRIRELQETLRRAQLIDPPASGDVVALGSSVTIVDGSGSHEQYTIVGSMEARVAAGRISDESPLGQALLGRKVGEETVVRSPSGSHTYTVSSIT